MKKFPIIIIFAFLFTSMQANKAEIVLTKESNIESISESDVLDMADRVYEIQSMDLNELSSSEKYALKYELNQIKSQIGAFIDGGGIYIGGATLLIVIILLLILL